eukprot:CAMPEP_0181534970 /NCGR_PEP_ID=MMETSP1110-20121109/74015_1 /TAXON_ID=174948 /ORGANISM="Symbiodinium sp., Strain CCMP421" /LENGTH=146 /DNA_ID=CAMNT_0023666337 /DNA_START=156 /DNA_END=597 /DNA_ORIENTATION=-
MALPQGKACGLYQAAALQECGTLLLFKKLRPLSTPLVVRLKALTGDLPAAAGAWLRGRRHMGHAGREDRNTCVPHWAQRVVQGPRGGVGVSRGVSRSGLLLRGLGVLGVAGAVLAVARPLLQLGPLGLASAFSVGTWHLLWWYWKL